MTQSDLDPDSRPRGVRVDWRVGSETGRLTEALMCWPAAYEWQPINEIVERTLHSGFEFDAEAARQQYGEFVAVLEGAGVDCHFLEPQLHLPYQVFARDPGLVTPWGPVLTQVAMAQRRGEYARVLRFFLDRHVGIWKLCDDGFLEGSDVHMIRPGVLLIGYGSGTNTDFAGARQLGRWYRAEGWRVRVQRLGRPFSQLNRVFTMAAPGLALACTEAMPCDFPEWLEDVGVRVLPVGYREALKLGCNVLALGDDRVLCARHNAEVNDRLRAEGLRVLDPDIGYLALGGGGPHDLVMPLARKDSKGTAEATPNPTR